MIPIKGCVLASIISWALNGLLPAQEDKSMADKVAPIAQQLAGWQKILSARNSLSLIATATGHVEPGFGHDADPDFTATFQLFYKGNRFLYNTEFLGPKGVIYKQVEAFDGEHYQVLDRNGELSISAKPFLYDIVMCQGHIFFLPFSFLQSGFRKDALAQLSYDQLTKEDDWKNALGSTAGPPGIEEVELQNQVWLKIANIGMDLDPVSDLECHFDVYFARNFHWYPMKWERRSWKGKITTSYVVEELAFVSTANGEKIPYPKRSVLKHYVEGKLRDTKQVEVKGIDFDSVRDGDVTIDPATADRIRNIDIEPPRKARK